MSLGSALKSIALNEGLPLEIMRVTTLEAYGWNGLLAFTCMHMVLNQRQQVLCAAQ